MSEIRVTIDRGRNGFGRNLEFLGSLGKSGMRSLPMTIQKAAKTLAQPYCANSHGEDNNGQPTQEGNRNCSLSREANAPLCTFSHNVSRGLGVRTVCSRVTGVHRHESIFLDRRREYLVSLSNPRRRRMQKKNFVNPQIARFRRVNGDEEEG